jgi:MFS transporter, DHA1 family, multidrug resistance protein
VVLGLSVAAMTVAGRAAIRDGFEPEAGEQALAKAFAGMGISAVVAGAAGGELAQWLSWRMVMALLAVAGAVLWLWAWWGFRPAPVRHAEVPQALPGGPAQASPLSQILGNSTFWFSTLVASASFSEAVCFVGGSSLVLPGHFGASPATLGWTLTICSGSFLISTFVCQWMLRRWGGRAAMRFSCGVAIVAAGLFALASTLQGEIGLICLVIAQITYMQCHGANQICGQASAVAPFPDHAGLAAAWSGTIMILIGVLCGQAQSMWLDQGLHHMPHVLTAIALVSAVLAWRQSRNEPSH